MVSLPEVQQNGGRTVEEKKDKELTEEELEQAVGGKLTRLIDGDRGGPPGLNFRTTIAAPSKRGRYILRGQFTSTGPPLSDFVTFDVR